MTGPKLEFLSGRTACERSLSGWLARRASKVADVASSSSSPCQVRCHVRIGTGIITRPTRNAFIGHEFDGRPKALDSRLVPQGVEVDQLWVVFSKVLAAVLTWWV